MDPASPNYYEILGLLPSATPEEVKRRYRELARRYHPDVARTPNAADRFKEINEANAVLSDAGRRANYDAHLKLAELKRQPPRSEKAEEQTRRPGSGETGRQGRRETRGQAGGGTGRAASGSGGAARQGGPGGSKAGGGQEQVAQILHEARRALSRLKFREAEVLARRANKMRRTSLGYEILGDVFRARGSADEAVAMYSYALQLDRANHDVQRKFDRLVGQHSGPTMAGSAARAARSARPARRPDSGACSTRPAAVGATVIGLAAFAALLIASSRLGSPAADPWLVDWDGLYVFALAASGVVAGFLLSLHGLLPGARGELLVGAPRSGRSPAMPVGPLVIAFSLLNFYAALIVFLVAGFLTDRLQKSLALAFAASFAVTLIYSIVNASAAPWTLLSGAGVVLLGFLGGGGPRRAPWGWRAGGRAWQEKHRDHAARTAGSPVQVSPRAYASGRQVGEWLDELRGAFPAASSVGGAKIKSAARGFCL